ncbi:hypothetical protein L5515_003018 [Caenorhabditis briggsae]|uniref:Uncharacterized protein n=1 Tax=Caenorhabditis briggsae TaxID=6238 RepID=A0AAE9EFY5_CAEBR|nr:hypothetical protein L5515_003018 [Caenorhabditis briggsae]
MEAKHTIAEAQSIMTNFDPKRYNPLRKSDRETDCQFHQMLISQSKLVQTCMKKYSKEKHAERKKERQEKVFKELRFFTSIQLQCNRCLREYQERKDRREVWEHITLPKKKMEDIEIKEEEITPPPELEEEEYYDYDYDQQAGYDDDYDGDYDGYGEVGTSQDARTVHGTFESDPPSRKFVLLDPERQGPFVEGKGQLIGYEVIKEEVMEEDIDAYNEMLANEDPLGFVVETVYQDDDDLEYPEDEFLGHPSMEPLVDLLEDPLEDDGGPGPAPPPPAQKRLVLGMDDYGYDPITPHRRRPLSPSARPTKSSLKIPPESNNFHQSLSPEAPDEKNQTADESIIAAASAMFRRNGFGRRSERYTSATMGSSMSDLEESLSPRGKPEAEEPKLKRNSFLRRSLNAFRSKSKRHNTASTTRVAPIPEESLPLFSEDEDEETTTPSQQKDKKSSMKSLWKRLFVSKKGKVSADGASGQVQLLRHQKKEEGSFFNDTISFVRLQNEHDDPSADSVSPPNIGNFALGYYMGIGRKFERIAGGSEITLVVFGHAGAGKTTLVRSIRQLFLDGTSDRIRVIPLAERYRLAGIGMMPYPEGDNRLPHIVSLIINISDDVEHVLDIIDPEYDNTNLPQAYMDACDAALLLIDARNCASLLSAHQIHRNMKSAKHAHVQCEMLMNIPSESSGQSRALSSNALETTMSKGAPIKELCATQLARAEVQEILISMCERVSTARIPTAIPTSIPTTS